MKFFLAIFAQFFYLAVLSQVQPIDSSSSRIDEEKFIRINGIEQWVTIKGNRLKPVILFLHGGPGSPLSPYADAIYKKWEDEFILVQWDQRGTARTFGRVGPRELTPEYLKTNSLTSDSMADDGIALTRYLLAHLEKQKLILMGTSWGSVLGVKMATKNPELFFAYIGHSQVVNPLADLIVDYNKISQLARDRQDTASLAILKSIGRPPYERARNAGKLFRIIKKYEKSNSVAPPPSWFTISPKYDNEKDSFDRENGDDFSFANYVGDKQFGIAPMMNSVNFLRDRYVFKIPVYLIQGKEDLLTPEVTTREYFNKIKAPKKRFFALDGAAHGFNQSVVDTQYLIVKEFVMQDIKKREK